VGTRKEGKRGKGGKGERGKWEAMKSQKPSFSLFPLFLFSFPYTYFIPLKKFKKFPFPC
jgi:hypothetical protein